MNMKQVVFTAEQKAELLTQPADIAALAPGEIFGTTLYTLISPGTELNMYLGNYAKRGLDWGKFPCTPGYAAVFRVEQIGDKVTDVKPGDLMYCMGKHQSTQRVTRSASAPVPQGLNPLLAPFARLMNVTMSSLTDTIARPPAKVVVTGLGIVGLLGAQMFARCGYEVVAVDPLAERRTDAQRAGLKTVLSALPLEDPEIAGKVVLVLECASVEQAVLDGCKLLKKGGEVILVGTQMVRHSDLTAQELLYHVFRQGVAVRGGSEWRIPMQETDYRQNSCWLNMEKALGWLSDGSVTVEGLYSAVSPQDPQSTYQKVLKKTTERLCTLFDWSLA